MADIDVTRPHGRSPEEVRRRAERLIEKLGERYQVKHRWEGDTLHFSRSGLSGKLDITPDKVQVTAKLGMLLKPFKSRIAQEVENAMNTAFG